MATMYKTPGVYIEEIVKFPPSVAQVETAIPAFIGYTEKAKKKDDDDLIMNPTRITSLLEYEAYFGFARKEDGITAKIVDFHSNGELERSLTVKAPTNPKPFLMYYSLQMYFANGGGPCYIIPVNTYTNDSNAENPILFNQLNDGLNELRSKDEPTLILFPDAKALSRADFYSLYNNALIQCNELQDRFTIIDTHTSSDVLTDSANLRAKLNLEKDYLKYGAAYYPYLETILDYNYDGESIIIDHTTNIPSAISTAVSQLESYKSDFENESNLLRDTANPNLGYIGVSKKLIQDELSNFSEAGPSFKDLKQSAENLHTETTKVITSLENLNSLRGLVEDAANAAEISSEEDSSISDEIANKLTSLNDLFIGSDKVNEVISNLALAIENLAKANSKVKIESQVNVISSEINKVYEGSTDIAANALTIFYELIVAVKAADSTDLNNGELNGRTLSSIENLDSQIFNQIKLEINNLPVILPPSSTMAGIYARVDSERGVWKAPANVGVNYVMQPSIQISHDQQKDLNVHTTGKSINAIRTFLGKGNLVWGARTLAGNDNEWRYVSVRRFFNMAEESIKKATEQFVFEPNDKNTWVRVKAMIDNFLTQQWKAGALAGPTPDKAFYVSVGLGETMTAQDILEGNMIIEIGMAVVRPAEFIILKFSHKMQEA